MEKKYLALVEETLRSCMAEYMTTPNDKTEVAVKIALYLYKQELAHQSATQSAA